MDYLILTEPISQQLCQSWKDGTIIEVKYTGKTGRVHEFGGKLPRSLHLEDVLKYYTDMKRM